MDMDSCHGYYTEFDMRRLALALAVVEEGVEGYPSPTSFRALKDVSSPKSFEPTFMLVIL